ncbi:hypothetical protein ArV2_gp48 [Arthrobacter phage vB_ArS-ArV2]|uniref:Uncharacterized protein n=1 Tax=Arthrobacter phage vB_ArS-ArV2 TaxID=1414742 RepID=V5RBF1_9CAUD|nr:hypothetical protein ArV2_gp48 [Arthrobacter phage vB_ArS-ArV2]AHB31659.1 hypothetical protein ArV2_gp48 [Arthrobacter phage vB_ArS-ArV2]
MTAKTMAEVLAEHQQKVGVRDMRSHCWCGWAGEPTGIAFIAHQAAALSAAGFGLVTDAKAEALEDAADALECQPPKPKAQYVKTLRLYASEPWRLGTCPSECAAMHPGREHAEDATTDRAVS